MHQRMRMRARVCAAACACARRPPHARWIHSQQRVQDALREAREKLRTVSVDGATGSASDAKPLVAHALQPPLASGNDVFLHLDRQLTAVEAQQLTDALARRCSGEPLAYITGRKAFWSLEFGVTPATLIPRSDSEVLIETLVAQYPKRSELRILDIGTGSGCLLLSALSEFPLASGVGVDISADALQVACQNARTHRLSDRVAFLQHDLERLPSLLATHARQVPDKPAAGIELLLQQFDVVLCNPPYIPRSELHLVASDVLAHEPHLALFSDGPDAANTRASDEHQLVETTAEEKDPEGLRMYRYLQQSVDRLFTPSTAAKKPSSLIVEVGSQAQAEAVRELFTSSSSASLEFKDFLLDGQQRYRGLLFQRRR